MKQFLQTTCMLLIIGIGLHTVSLNGASYNSEWEFVKTTAEVMKATHNPESGCLFAGAALTWILLPVFAKMGQWIYYTKIKEPRLQKQLHKLQQQEKDLDLSPIIQDVACFIGAQRYKNHHPVSNKTLQNYTVGSTAYKQKLTSSLKEPAGQIADKKEKIAAQKESLHQKLQKHQTKCDEQFPYRNTPYNFLSGMWSFKSDKEIAYTGLLTYYTAVNVSNAIPMRPKIAAYCAMGLFCAYMISAIILHAIINPPAAAMENRKAQEAHENRIARFHSTLWLTACLATNGALLYCSAKATKA